MNEFMVLVSCYYIIESAVSYMASDRLLLLGKYYWGAGAGVYIKIEAPLPPSPLLELFFYWLRAVFCYFVSCSLNR